MKVCRKKGCRKKATEGAYCKRHVPVRKPRASFSQLSKMSFPWQNW